MIVEGGGREIPQLSKKKGAAELKRNQKGGEVGEGFCHWKRKREKEIFVEGVERNEDGLLLGGQGKKKKKVFNA